LSYLWVPSFVYRYAFSCAIPTYLFFGGLVARSSRGARVVTLTVLGLLAVYQAAFVLAQPMRADWRAAADAIARSPYASHPVIVMKYHCAYAFRYYLGRSERRVSPVSDVPEMIAKTKTTLRNGRGVWLLVNDTGLDAAPTSERLDNALRQARLVFIKRTFHTASPVSVYHVRLEAVQSPALHSILPP